LYLTGVIVKEIDADTVFTVYRWLQSAMYTAGRSIKFPRCKDVTKTYQYRWTKLFAEKCYNDLGLDNKLVKALVYDMVRYAKTHDILNKGTQILCMNNIVEICAESIKTMIDAEGSLIYELRRSKAFLDDHGSGEELYQRMVEPVAEGGYPYIVAWYMSNEISRIYVSISERCQRAINALSNDDRGELPSNYDMFRICTQVVTSETYETLNAILGRDLRVPPTALRKLS
jgi:hypothetical protein